MKRICVYSGSNLGLRPEYREMTKKLGDVLLENNLELVYGGSKVGLMGELAHYILDNGGSVTGVVPKGLFPDTYPSQRLTQLIEVGNMHDRKQTMENLSDAFIAIPGGIGTFEELFETLSWAQLGLHQKPIGILNVSHFFDEFLILMEKLVSEGFMNASNLKLFLVSSDPGDLLNQMRCYTPPVLGNKWRELD
jgi:uncharacterized protein (TIGR00730 family)